MIIMNISDTKLITLLGSVLVLVNPDMLFERDVSDTCDVLETEVHMVSIGKPYCKSEKANLLRIFL